MNDKFIFNELLDHILKLKQTGDAVVAELVMHVVACRCQLMVGNTTGEMCASCQDARSKIQDYHIARAKITTYVETKQKGDEL